MIYDIIGDIHGKADKLHALLQTLGYTKTADGYHAPAGHKAIFLGDFIDRGNGQLQVLNTVFAMLDNNQAYAVMGNHEYNAIGYATQNGGGFYRKRNEQNTIQHQAFLLETGIDTPLHRHWINRFYELPLWLDLPELRVVHACYDQNAIKLLSPYLKNNRLTPDSFRYTAEQSDTESAIERLLKGIEIHLKKPNFLIDGSGNKRQNLRLAWWHDNFDGLSLQEISAASQCDLSGITEPITNDNAFIYNKEKPIFIGHYWLMGVPNLLNDTVVCVDYSAGKDGTLTAYQFDTKNPSLSAKNFIQ